MSAVSPFCVCVLVCGHVCKRALSLILPQAFLLEHIMLFPFEVGGFLVIKLIINRDKLGVLVPHAGGMLIARSPGRRTCNLILIHDMYSPAGRGEGVRAKINSRFVTQMSERSAVKSNSEQPEAKTHGAPHLSC